MIRADEYSEYIFWLEFWRKVPSIWPNSGRFKCVATKEKIHIIPIDDYTDKELAIDISEIENCKLGYAQINYWQVELFLKRGRILLGPVHPIDPKGIQNLNRAEASALIKVIEAFRSNTDPGVDANPYTRQLAEKNNLKGFRIPEIKWDKYTSPWAYYDQYQGKCLQRYIFARKIAIGVVSGIIATLIVVAVFYLLLLLNVF